MSKKCADCGCEVNPNVIQGMYYCPRCDDDKTERDVLPLTVFDKITESVETLAEKLVYMRVVSWDDEINWYSLALRSHCFRTKEEAIAATIEELKKEVEDA